MGSVTQDGKALRKLILGLKVDRATANMTTGLELFTVSEGNCQVNLMVGEVTTAIENKTVNMTIVADPTTGTSTDIAALLDIDNDEAGGLYTVNGVAATALVRGLSGSVPAALQPFVVAPGAIEVTIGATHTGSIKWTIFYIPLEDGAYITST